MKHDQSLSTELLFFKKHFKALFLFHFIDWTEATAHYHQRNLNSAVFDRPLMYLRQMFSSRICRIDFTQGLFFFNHFNRHQIPAAQVQHERESEEK